MRGLKELHVQGAMHVKALTHLMHTLAERVPALEALHLHAPALTSSHSDSDASKERQDVESMLHSIARLPRLSHLSLAGCNLGFVVAQLWPPSSLHACGTVDGYGVETQRHRSIKTCSRCATCGGCVSRKNGRIVRNGRWLGGLEVLDLSGNGLDDTQLPVLLELLLGVQLVGRTKYRRESAVWLGDATGGNEKLRSWCEVDYGPKHSEPDGQEWKGKQMQKRAPCEVCGESARKVHRECGAHERALQAMRGSGEVLGAVATLKEVRLNDNMLSCMGIQVLQRALRAHSTAEAVCE